MGRTCVPWSHQRNDIYYIYPKQKNPLFFFKYKKSIIHWIVWFFFYFVCFGYLSIVNNNYIRHNIWKTGNFFLGAVNPFVMLFFRFPFWKPKNAIEKIGYSKLMFQIGLTNWTNEFISIISFALSYPIFSISYETKKKMEFFLAITTAMISSKIIPIITTMDTTIMTATTTTIWITSTIMRMRCLTIAPATMRITIITTTPTWTLPIIFVKVTIWILHWVIRYVATENNTRLWLYLLLCWAVNCSIFRSSVSYYLEISMNWSI